MKVIGKTEAKRIVLEVVGERFKRIEIELCSLRRTVRKLTEEIQIIKNFKSKDGKNAK